MLNAEERQRYRDQQFFGPITLMPKEKMTALRPVLERVLQQPGRAPAPIAEQSRGRLSELVASASGGSPVPYIECRHLDARVVYDLCTHPRLLDVARSLYGDDLILWRSTFIEKAAGGPEFRWHQDWGGVYGPGEEYGLEPPLLFTFWIAITQTTEENGCLRFIPQVRRVMSAMPASTAPRATMLIPEDAVDTSQMVAMPLAPGQCVVFTDRAMHASSMNRAAMSRLGLAVRFTLPAVQVRPHFDRHACILASGRDTVHLNTFIDPPHPQSLQDQR